MKGLAGSVRPTAGLVAGALALSFAGACSKQRDEQRPAGSVPTSVTSAPSAPLPAGSVTPVELPAPVASGLPDPKGVSDAVNPLGEKAYAGPTGTVRGRVVVKGDEAPSQPQILAKIPATCGATAREAYGKLFREGPGRALADVLVAVTGFKGYVPERVAAQRVVAKDCFYGTRTLALTYGQSIEVASGDTQSYIPELLGEKGQPQLVATPGGRTVATVYPTRAGRYVLIDNLKLFMIAEVMVLKYATHAVTGLDGRFEIPGVPVGEVDVNALLPVAGIGAARKVTVEAGKPTDEIEFELTFDKAALEKQAAADAGAPSPSASAAPSAAPSAKRSSPAPKPSH
jgi:hypothetical protein